MFKIMEYTRSEYLSVDYNNNLRRWSLTGKDDQLWVVLPVEGDRFRFLSKKQGEYMSVGSNGNVVCWAETGGDTQQFRLVNADPTGMIMQFQELTKGEFVSVGSDGNILRWAKSDNAITQYFGLIPYNHSAPPALPMLEAEINKHGEPPELTSLSADGVPDETPKKLVAATWVPATIIGYVGYSDRFAQIQDSPYYLMERYQFWSRKDGNGYLRPMAASPKEETDTITITTKVRNRSQQTTEETFGMKFSLNAKASFTKKGEGKTIGVSGGMAFELSQQLRLEFIQEHEVERTVTREIKHTYPGNQPAFTIAGWSRVDEFRLYKYSLSAKKKVEIARVEVPRTDVFVSRAYPNTIKDPAVTVTVK